MTTPIVQLRPQSQAELSQATADVERFRLRNFVDKLEQSGELNVMADPVDLADIAAGLDGNPKAVLFRKAGPEQAELVGNGGRLHLERRGLNGDRRRLARRARAAGPRGEH
jgi:hypothetical protein